MTAFDEALELLPIWLRWGPIAVAFLVSVFTALVGVGVTTVLGLHPLRGAGELPWFERARIAQEVRTGQWIAGLYIWMMAVVVLIDLHSGELTGPRGVTSMAVNIGILSVFFAFRVRAERALGYPRLSGSSYLQGWIVLLLFFCPHLLIAVGLALFCPPHLGSVAAGLMLMGLIAVAATHTGFALDIARFLRLARRGDARLQRATERASEMLGEWVKDVHELRWHHANAFVFPLTRRVAVTTAALEVLDDDELVAVLCHELGHLEESRGVRIGRAALVFLPLPLVWSSFFESWFGTWGFLLIGAVIVFSMLLAPLAFNRHESQADAVTAEAGNALHLARALEKLHISTLTPAVFGGRTSHADLCDRMTALGLEPSYPRPAPPSRKRCWGLRIAGGLAGILCLAGIEFGLASVATGDVSSPRAVLFGLDADSLIDLGQERLAAGDLAGAKIYLLGARDFGETPVRALAWLSIIAASQQQCGDARVLLAEGECLGEGPEHGENALLAARRLVSRCVDAHAPDFDSDGVVDL
ncbi:MAG: M48 family metalloprotease [Myxococcales bacterium]|jgi:Zn-dependent protease with chaperone function|nr:M48 family metalloprotease [Myxococcales bacterium]